MTRKIIFIIIGALLFLALLGVLWFWLLHRAPEGGAAGELHGTFSLLSLQPKAIRRTRPPTIGSWQAESPCASHGTPARQTPPACVGEKEQADDREPARISVRAAWRATSAAARIRSAGARRFGVHALARGAAHVRRDAFARGRAGRLAHAARIAVIRRAIVLVAVRFGQRVISVTAIALDALRIGAV